MANEMSKAGFSLSKEDELKLQSSLTTLRKKFKSAICKKCGERITFLEGEKEKIIPHNLDQTPHWQTCAYSAFTQKKASLDILKKLAVLFVVKLGFDLETEASLSKKEAQIVHALLEKMFKEDSPFPVDTEDQQVDDEVQFKPEPCDSVGDPDEERAPSEELVKEIENSAISENGPADKGTVERAIEEMIQEKAPQV